MIELRVLGRVDLGSPGAGDTLFAHHHRFGFLNAVMLAPDLRYNPRFRAVLQRYGVDPSGNNGLNDGWIVKQFDRGAETANP